MGIIELCRQVGEDNICMQQLQESLVQAQQTKHGTRVTFLTNQLDPSETATGRYRKLGLVVWLPMEAVERIRAEGQGE